MRKEDTKRTLTRGGLALQAIVELEASLQSGGLLFDEETDCGKTNKNSTYVGTKGENRNV